MLGRRKYEKVLFFDNFFSISTRPNFKTIRDFRLRFQALDPLRIFSSTRRFWNRRLDPLSLERPNSWQCHLWFEIGFFSISARPSVKTTRDSAFRFEAFDSLRSSCLVRQFLDRKLDLFSLETRKYMEVSF